jgi:hypothetical protein
MESNSFNSKKALTGTKIIYYSLLTGTLLFLLVTINMQSGQLFFKADFSDPLILVLFVLFCLMIPGGYYFAKLYYKRVVSDSTPEVKYGIYQAGLLIRISLCEAVSLFAIICLLMTNNLFSVLFLAAAIMTYILYFPTPGKIAKELNLNDAEADLFYQNR